MIYSQKPIITYSKLGHCSRNGFLCNNSYFVLDLGLSFVCEYDAIEHDPQRGEPYVT